ncbi:TetR/AcrR family transcriptional regulator [Gordonia sp. NPDC003424]
MSSPKLWRGQPLDVRSSERREEILAVAEALLGDSGASAVTMRAVVRAANLSPRYFYESFASTDELLTAVYDRVEAQMIERITSVGTKDTLRKSVRAIFEAFRDFFDDDPRRARILLREPLANEVLREHSAARIPAFVRTLTPVLGRDSVADDDASLAISATALSGALVALYLDYSDGRLRVDPERLVDAAVDLVFAIAGLTDEGDAASSRPWLR